MQWFCIPVLLGACVAAPAAAQGSASPSEPPTVVGVEADELRPSRGPMPVSWARAWQAAPEGFKAERAFSEPWICETHFVLVDAEAIFGRPVQGTRSPSPGVVLPLGEFGDVGVRRIDRQLGVDPAACWYGELPDEPGGYALFVMVDGEVAGKVQSPRLGAWELVRAGPGVSALRRIQEFALPGCGNTPAQEAFAPAGGAPREHEEPSPTASDRGLYYFVDVLLPYTTAARIVSGSAAALEALITLAVADTNAAYENSDMIVRVRIAGMVEVNYQESGDLGTDLGRLAGTGDGYMDSVHLTRAQTGADMVALITSSSAGGACGIGYLMTVESVQFSSLAFTVTGMNCLTQFTLAHELGHNMGCAHDRDNAGSPGCFSYSYGYRAPGAAFRTIMAYAPGTRIAHFSNPDVTFNGQATGVPIGLALETANAQTMNQTADTVSNWRSIYTSAPGTFNLLGPPNGGTTPNRHPLFTWQAANQTDYYSLEVDDDPAFLSPIIDQSLLLTTSYQVTSTALQLGGTYYWRVKAYNPLGSSLSTPQFWSFAVPFNPPGAFALSSPAPGQTGVPVTPLFEWTLSTDADTYSLTVDDNPDFLSPAINIGGIAGTSYAVPPPGLAPMTTYFWRVRATNIVTTTTSTPASSQFTTAQLPPGAFALTSPGDGAFLPTLTPTLQWSASPNASNYEVVVDDQPTLNTPVYSASGVVGTSRQIPAGVLLNNGYYFWQVKAVNSAGTVVGSPPTYGFGISLAPCSGDANGDRVVNFSDITSVLANFGGPGPQGDANSDGSVNFVDVTTVLTSYQQPCP